MASCLYRFLPRILGARYVTPVGQLLTRRPFNTYSFAEHPDLLSWVMMEGVSQPDVNL